MQKKVLSLIIFLALVFGISYIGNLATMPAIPGWYAALNKPLHTPPNWVFAPVWTTLYVLIAISGWMVWNRLPGSFGAKLKTLQMKAYATQLALNLLWSLLFFGMQSPLLAMVDITALLIVIAINIKAFARVSKPAAYLMVPYILWVAYAATLNAGIVYLN